MDHGDFTTAFRKLIEICRIKKKGRGAADAAEKKPDAKTREKCAAAYAKLGLDGGFPAYFGFYVPCRGVQQSLVGVGNCELHNQIFPAAAFADEFLPKFLDSLEKNRFWFAVVGPLQLTTVENRFWGIKKGRSISITFLDGPHENPHLETLAGQFKHRLPSEIQKWLDAKPERFRLQTLLNRAVGACRSGGNFPHPGAGATNLPLCQWLMKFSGALMGATAVTQLRR